MPRGYRRARSHQDADLGVAAHGAGVLADDVVGGRPPTSGSAAASPRARCGPPCGPARRRGRSGCRSRTTRGGRIWRRTSNRSASGNTRSSRPALPVSSSTFEPAGIVDAVQLDRRASSTGPGPATAPRSAAAPRPRWRSARARPPARPAGRGARRARTAALPSSRPTVSVPALKSRLANVGDLVAVEATGGAVVVGDLGLAERADQVVLRVRPRGGRPARARYPCSAICAVERDVVDHPDAGLDVEDLVDVVALLLLVLRRHAERASRSPSTAAGRRSPARSRSVRCPTSGSSSSAQSSRMRSSSLVTRRGVNARDTSARSVVCSGGSMKII